MSAPDDEKPLSVNTGKHIALRRPEIDREATPRAFPPAERSTAPRTAPIELTEEQRAEALKYLFEPDREPPPPPPKARKVPVKSPDPDLLRWALKYVRQLRTPRTAREIVTHWYSTWHGHPDRPKTVTKAHKAGHVDRMEKWLERHEKKGRLRMVGRRGSLGPRGKMRWPAKSYLPVEGAVWKRRPMPSDISPNSRPEKHI